jgi:triosephosphate isomerase
MLAEIGCGYVIVGHSERRNLFGETDEIVKNKVLAALRHRLIPIVCVGENEEERKCGEAEKVVERQLRMALDGVRFSPHGCVIAYEPVWAIGTGNAGNPADVVRIHTTIWRILSELMERTLVDSVRIVYGGSINSGNSYAFLREQAIDGLLVGGASVKISQWSEILHTATQVIESQQ